MYRLSALQEGILFHVLGTTKPDMYITQYSCTFEGDLDPESLKHAWQTVVNRHAVLRTLVSWERSAAPLQIVRELVSLPWEYQDWRGASHEEQTRRWQLFLLNDRKRSFDLRQAPLMRIALVRRGGRSFRLLWTFHHIILDGWSTQVILKEVRQFYQSCRDHKRLEKPLARQYHDFIVWLKKRDSSKDEAFWSKMMSGFSGPTQLPFIDVTPAATKGDAGFCTKEVRLGRQKLADLANFARREQLTLNTLVLGAWAFVLSSCSGSKDVMFGTTVSGRSVDLDGADRIAGLLINTIPLRVSVPDEVSLLAWLQEIQSRQVKLRQFEHTPLTAIHRWSDVAAGQPLFETIVVYEKVADNTASTAFDQSLTVSEEDYSEYSHYPLAILVLPGDELVIRAVYDPQRIAAADVELVLGYLQIVLDNLVESSGQSVCELSIMSARQRHMILQEWNDTTVDAPKDRCIQQLFEDCVERSPQALAVVSGTETVTYEEFDRKANQLAHFLQQSGIQQAAVPIFLERTVEAIVTMFGVLKAGMAYVPLDPKTPKERIRQVLDDVSATDANTSSIAAPLPLVVTQSRIASRLPLQDCRVFCIDEDWSKVETQISEKPNIAPDPKALAYIMYTSGSTGRSKGVLISHRNLVNSTYARTIYYPEPLSSFLLLSPLATDSSVAGIFWSLCTGATLILPKKRAEQEIGSLTRQIAERSVSHLLCLPSLHNLILEHSDSGSIESLKVVIVAGEACTRDIVERHHDTLPAVSLYNEYGPTESTVWATATRLVGEPADWRVTIGRPIPNVAVYILDEFLRPVPVGMKGELYIGGAGVADGYLNQPERTSEQFIANPFPGSTGGRLYKTGDLARYLPDGNIEFLGRIDNQIKIRGYRIEIEEIEQTLLCHSSVSQAAVVMTRSETTDIGVQRLVACIVSQSDRGAGSDELRKFLIARLPAYMVPQGFELLEKLPRNASGKIDRRALENDLRFIPVEAEDSYTAPRNEIEEKLTRIWADTLRADKISVHDNFFEVGGDSLLSIRILAQLARQGLRISPETFFGKPTIAEQAEFVEVSPKPGQDRESFNAKTTAYASPDKPAANLDPDEITRVSQLLIDIDSEDDPNN